MNAGRSQGQSPSIVNNGGPAPNSSNVPKSAGRSFVRSIARAFWATIGPVMSSTD